MTIDGKAVGSAERGDTVELAVDGQVYPQDRGFLKTHDEALITQAQESISRHPDRKIRVDVTALMRQGEPFLLTFKTENGQQVEVQSKMAVQAADHHPLDEPTLREKIEPPGQYSVLSG